MKGIILAGGTGSRLYPATQVISKQLLPVYDKPMVYYALTTLMLAGIRKILVISTPADISHYERLLGTGEQWGIQLTFKEQRRPGGIPEALIIGEPFIQDEPVCLILGDNIFYGSGLVQSLQSAASLAEGALLFAYRVSDPSAYGVVTLDNNKMPLAIEEKPQHSRSHFAVPGLYFYEPQVCQVARTLEPSSRGELEITDINQYYLKQQKLNVKVFSRGIAWLDMGTPESLLSAANYIHTLEARQGLKIGCPEEVAWQMGYISNEQLRDLAKPLMSSGYGDYLLKVLEGHRTLPTTANPY